MRRFLAFVMCVSGFTLAVSWTRADEPATATADATPQPLPESTQPSARPEVVRTEPGSYRHQREVDSGQPSALDANENVPPSDSESRQEVFPEQRRQHNAAVRKFIQLYNHVASQDEDLATQIREQIEQLEQLFIKSERLSEKYSGTALQDAQAHVESQIAGIQDFLKELSNQQWPAPPSQSARAAEQNREEPAQPERPADYSAARIRQMQQRMAEIRSDRAEQGDSVAQRLEQNLERLHDLAESIQDSATAEAETARQAIEREIDNVERYLAERRERRDAAELAPEQQGERTERDRDRDDDDSPERTAALSEVRERLRHINAAVEHLEEAGLHDIARNLQQQAREMAFAHERAQQQRRRSAAERERAAAARVHAADSPQVHELAKQIGELRRELRRLRQEVTELREQHARPSEESNNN